MDDKNQNLNSAQMSYGTVKPVPPSPSAFSLDESASAGVSPAVSGSAQKKPNPLVSLAKRADVVLAILLILGSAGLFLSVYLNRSAEEGAGSGATSRFDPLQLPLEEFVTGEGVDFGTQQVTINGGLDVNGDFVLAPSLQPSSATAGQLYYDQTSNVLSYYNGVEFVSVGDGVTSVQGQSGDVTLTGADGITVTDDGAGNVTITGPGIPAPASAGVTSLNGLTGAISINNSSAAGSSVTISDASTSSKGIAQFNGTNFTVSGGVVNTVQDINTSATPTFTGVNADTIQGGTGLSLLSGGNVAIGSSDGSGTLLVVDTKTTAGDPTGVDGAIYYNSDSGNFRCYQGGSWVNCITASGGFVSLQNAYDNSTPAIVNLNATNDGILVRDTVGGIGGNLFAVQNSDGSTSYLGVTTAGISVEGDVTASGNATLQGGGLTVGVANTQTGALTLANGSSAFTGTLQVAALGQDTVYTLPDPGQATASLCLSTGNCSGAGGGVTTGGGTVNRLAKFTSGQNIEDSSITDDGSTVTTTSDMVIQGGNLTVGVAGSQLGSLALAHSNGQSTTLQAGASTGDLTFVLPTGAGSQFQCLKKDTGDQLIWDDCEGGGGGVTTTFQQVYNASNPAMFTLNGANGGLTIRDNATPIGADLFAIQNSDGSSTYLAQTTSALTLGTNIDLLLQGATAYISNPQTQSGSEAFGLNADVGGASAVAVGNGAIGGASGVAVGSGADASGNGIAIGQASNSNSSSVAVGQGANAAFQDSIAIGRGAVTTASNQLVIGDSQNVTNFIDDVYIGNGVTDAAPQGFTLNATGGNGTDIAGAGLNIAGGRGTGTGNGGDINLQVALPTTTGSTPNNLTTALNVSGSTGVISLGTSGAGGLDGQLAFRNTTSSNVITLQAEVATANQNITLPNATGTVCLTSGNCAGTGGNGDVLQNGNSFGTTMTLGTNDNFNFGLETRGTTWVTIEGTALQADLASRVVLASNMDLIMQGATSYISNPMGGTDSEGFGLNVNMSSASQAVAFGNSAQTCNNSVAIGYSVSITCGSGAVAIGHDAGTNGGSVAIGQSSGTGVNGVAIGNGATSSGDGVALGFGATGSSNAITIGSGSTNSTGGIVIGDSASVSTNNSIAIGVNASVGTNANDTIVIGEGAAASGSAQSNHLVVGSNAMSIQQGFIGNGITNATPQGFTLNATGGNGTNIQGANLNLAGGKGTGSANGGDINFQITFGGQTSGTTLRDLETVGTFSGVDGSFTLQNATDSTTALEVLNQDGTISVLSVDTSTPGIQLNGAGTDNTGAAITFGTGLHAPSIRSLSDAEVSWFGEDTLSLSVAGLQIHSTADDQLTDPPLFQMDGFNGRFTFRNGSDDFGFIQYVDTNDNVLFGINDQAGNGEATFQNNTDSSIAFRVLNAGGSSLLTVNTTDTRIDLNADLFFTGVAAQTNGNTSLCISGVTGQVFLGATASSCDTSSARYKENIQNLEDEKGLELINALRPVTYTYENGDGKTNVGLIAEEVHELLPEVVVYDDQGRPNAINYEVMVANLIKAIQQQQVQIDELRQGVLSGGLVEITGHIRVGKDTAGTVVIPAGQTSVNVAFKQAYETPPIVTTGSHDFVMVRVLNTTTTGFTFAIPEPAAHDIRINWTALEPDSVD